jgi:hypothetical protein
MASVHNMNIMKVAMSRVGRRSIYLGSPFLTAASKPEQVWRQFGSTMKLLEQITLHAVDEKADLPRLLRLCLVLATQLQHEPFKKWVTDELEGYRDDEVPSYRIFSTRVRGKFQNSHYESTLDIPLEHLPEEAQMYLAQIHFRASVSATLRLLDSQKDKACLVKFPLDAGLAATTGAFVVQNAQCVSMWQEFNGVYLDGLIDNLKTRILRFALEVEQQYPDLGDSSKLPAIVNGAAVANIFNTTINGQVGNFASGSQNFTQNGGIDAKEFSAMLESLRTAGIPGSEVDELQQAVEKTPPSNRDGLVNQCRNWLGSLAMKAIEPEASDLAKSEVLAAKDILKPLLGG